VGDVVFLSGETTLDIPPDRALQAAVGRGFRQVVIAAEDEDGQLYVAASAGSCAYSLMLLELAKRRLLERIEDGE